MTLAFSSKHPHVPNPRKDPNATRWIASLSDGTTVFEDVTPGERSAWLRLREYVANQKLKMTNLRLEAYGRQIVLIPYKGEGGEPQVNGYWHSKVSEALLTGGGILSGEARGIGILKGKEVWITWVHQSGEIRQDIRPYKPNDLSLVINDLPC